MTGDNLETQWAKSSGQNVWQHLGPDFGRMCVRQTFGPTWADEKYAGQSIGPRFDRMKSCLVWQPSGPRFTDITRFVWPNLAPGVGRASIWPSPGPTKSPMWMEPFVVFAVKNETVTKPRDPVSSVQSKFFIVSENMYVPYTLQIYA